jgi:hypothetical protein
MPIVSAVVYVNHEEISKVRQDLSMDSRISIGEAVHDRLPVVIDTATPGEDKRFWRELGERDEVRFLEIIFADFSDIHSAEEGCL